MKKKVIIIIGILVLACLIGATIFSINKFGVINPILSCCGMLQILLTDKEYTVVQNFPYRVVFSKADRDIGVLLNRYMKNRGFELAPEKTTEFGTWIYTNGTDKEYIDISGNMYYAKWVIGINREI